MILIPVRIPASVHLVGAMGGLTDDIEELSSYSIFTDSFTFSPVISNQLCINILTAFLDLELCLLQFSGDSLDREHVRLSSIMSLLCHLEYNH